MKNNTIIYLSFFFIVFISCQKESSRINNNNNYTKPLDSCFYFILNINGTYKEFIDTAIEQSIMEQVKEILE